MTEATGCGVLFICTTICVNYYIVNMIYCSNIEYYNYIMTHIRYCFLLFWVKQLYAVLYRIISFTFTAKIRFDLCLTEQISYPNSYSTNRSVNQPNSQSDSLSVCQFTINVLASNSGSQGFHEFVSQSIIFNQLATQLCIEQLVRVSINQCRIHSISHYTSQYIIQLVRQPVK